MLHCFMIVLFLFVVMLRKGVTSTVSLYRFSRVNVKLAVQYCYNSHDFRSVCKWSL